MSFAAWTPRGRLLLVMTLIGPGVVGVQTGCDPCEGVDGPFAAELGTGVGTFEPLPATDASLPYVRGLQGGTHVDGAVLVTGLSIPPEFDTRFEEQPLMSFTLQDGDTLVGGFRDEPRTFFPDDAGETAFHTEPVVFFDDASVWVGTTLRLFVEVQDRCDNRVSDERDLTIRDTGT